MFLILLLSLPIPFLGRTAIVWLVDAITISGSIAYAYVSLCRYREAKKEDSSSGKALGAAGFILSLFFFFCPIIPDLLLGSTLETESYLLLAVWSILGLIYYWTLYGTAFPEFLLHGSLAAAGHHHENPTRADGRLCTSP